MLRLIPNNPNSWLAESILRYAIRSLSASVAMLILVFSAPNIGEALSINDRIIESSVETTRTLLLDFEKLLKVNPKAKRHVLATFSRYLSPGERKYLEQFGIRILEPYQDTTYWVRLSKSVDTQALRPSKLVFVITELLDQDRVHPKIWKKNSDSFVVDINGEPFNYVWNHDGTLNLTVRLHVDVSEGQATQLLSKYTKHFQKKTPATWVVIISRTGLEGLAKEDLVKWIEAGPLPFLGENDMTSAAIKVDLVRATPLDGRGVRIGIFDKGLDYSHPDFQGRINTYNAPNLGDPAEDDHGTAIAGTIAGSGLMSDQPNSNGCSETGMPHQWAGMAPAAFMIAVPSSDGDSLSVHNSLITSPQGMHLSNHSYVISDIDGQYSQKDADRDAMIRGSAPSISIAPRLSVLSAGNQGLVNEPYRNQYPQRHLYQKGYFSLTKQMKNGLVVGNLQAVDDNPIDLMNRKGRVFRTSSLGPAYDGRIKPDVVAPGRFIASAAHPDTEGGCTWYYLEGTGTSASAAAVSGSIGLLLQQHAKKYPLKPPLPSTLRGIIIHTAIDQKSDSAWYCNPDGASSDACPVAGETGHAPVWAKEGPDFVTGWGLVDALSAKGIVDRNSVQEGFISSTCEQRTYAFSVDSSNSFRITLAWDDLPANPSPQSPDRSRKLINDLDLVLVAPDGVKHYPWRLNQNMSNAAGVPITDATLESCTGSIVVTPQVEPTLTPSSNNDPVPVGPNGGFPPAVRGTDHLNNVEVVDVPSPLTGIWKAQVTGFGEPFGPQSFSLIGAQFVDISVPQATKCEIHALGCSNLSMITDCETNPQVCTNNYSFYGNPLDGLIRVNFDSYKDRAIIPINKLCEHASSPVKPLTCPPDPLKRYLIRVETPMAPQILDVQLYSDNGQLLDQSEYSTWKNQQKEVASIGSLLVVLKPTKLAKLRTNYEARILLGGRNQ